MQPNVWGGSVADGYYRFDLLAPAPPLGADQTVLFIPECLLPFHRAGILAWLKCAGSRPVVKPGGAGRRTGAGHRPELLMEPGSYNEERTAPAHFLARLPLDV